MAAWLSLGSSCSTSGTDPFSPPPPVILASPTGIWIGLITTSQIMSSDDSSCEIAETLQFVCIFTDTTTGEIIGGLDGAVTVDAGNQLNGAGRIYAAPGRTLPDGNSTVLDFSITGGSIVERTSIQINISAGGIPSMITGTFDTLYDRASAISIVEGVYSLFDIFGDTSSFTIDSQGAIFAQSMTGCTINGLVTLIDALFNAYRVEMTLSGCASGLNGDYTGLAITTDTAVIDDTFLFAAFNAVGMIAGEAEK